MGEKKPKGLLLDLKKRKLRLCQDDTHDFDYLLYGNFDGISFRVAYDWYDFAPTMEMNESTFSMHGMARAESFLDESYASTYILKVLFPNDQIELSRFGYDYGYDYDLWARAASKPDGEWKRVEEHHVPGCPFFAMIMINISDSLPNAKKTDGSKYFKDSKDLLSWLAQEIQKVSPKEDFSNFHCGLFETLGYYDYILLLRSDSLYDVSLLCSKIREIQAPDKSCAISACYSVLGIHNWTKSYGTALPPDYEQALVNAGTELDCIDISFQLHGGKTIQAIKKALQGKNISVSEKHSHGSVDAVLHFGGEQLSSIIPEYLSEGLLNPGNKNYNQIVISKKTSFIFRDSEEATEEASKEVSSDYVSKEHFKNLYEVWADFKALRTECNKSQRITLSLRQTILMYSTLTSGRHAFEFRYFLKPVFDSLYANMKFANERIWELRNSLKDGEDVLDDYQYEWEQYEIALQTFREMVSGFLSDVSRSEKYFFEDSQLKHPSIGSATKLIFLYNYFVEQIVEIVKETGTKSTYSFLVKSGGNDGVSVTNLFNYLPVSRDNQSIQEDCLLIIDIPERMLYNVQASMNSITHELFHIVGERERELRSEKIEEAVRGLISYRLTDFVFAKSNWEDLLKDDFSDKPKSKEEFWELFECEKREFKSVRLPNILKKYRCVAGNSAPGFFYGRSIVDTLKAYYWNRLRPNFECTNIFFNEIYHAVIESFINILDAFSQKDYLHRANAGRLLSKLKSYTELTGDLPKDNEFVLDQALFVKLWMTFGDMLVSTDGSQEDAYQIENFIDDCFSAMSEAYADCAMIKLWDISIAQYLAWFIVADDGGIDDILRENAETVLRIRCVLKAAYKRDRLESDDKDEISEFWKQSNVQKMFIYAPDVTELTCKVSDILEKCDDYYKETGIIDYITDYLVCTNQKLDCICNCSSELAAFRAFYRAWGEEGDYPHNTILNYWIKIAQEEKSNRNDGCAEGAYGGDKNE